MKRNNFEKREGDLFLLSPFSPSSFVSSFSCKVSFPNDVLKLTFSLQGELDLLAINHRPSQKRKIGLWQSTCFEFFIKARETDEYYEYNFSPNGDWNCFFFKERGQNLLEEKSVSPPSLRLQKDSEIEVSIESRVPSPLHGSSFYYYPTAVLDFNGELEYWAPEHFDKKPNFHHPLNFRGKK